MSVSNESNSDLSNSKPTRNVSAPKRRTATEPREDSIAEAMRRTEQALRTVQHSPPFDISRGTSPEDRTQDKHPDPAPSAPAIAEDVRSSLYRIFHRKCLVSCAPCASKSKILCEI